jgi:hypothetical protein
MSFGKPVESPYGFLAALIGHWLLEDRKDLHKTMLLRSD